MNSKRQKLAPLPELEQVNFILPRRYDVSEMVRDQENAQSKLMKRETSM